MASHDTYVPMHKKPNHNHPKQHGLFQREGGSHRGESNLLLRDKVDLGTVKLGLEVVNISPKKNE